MDSGHRFPRKGRPSQCDRLLEILTDGRWHNSAHLHRTVLCVLHSRIAELRRRGYQIERRGSGAGAEHYDYRLVATPEEAGRTVDGLSRPRPASSGALAASPSPELVGDSLPPQAGASGYLQLSLVAA